MKTKFTYIAEISNEMFEKENVLPFTNEEGKSCILIRNKKNKINLSKGSTDNLEYHLNSVFYKDRVPHYFHMLSCIKEDKYSKEQFEIAYEYLFKSLKEPKTDFDIYQLINSLEQLFKVTPDKDLKKIQTGVYGELLFVLVCVENGAKNILNKYHRNFFSKHDLELDSKNRVEIKSTIGLQRIHHFSHEQLVRNDVNVYVCSTILEESSEGVTLYELFERILKITSDPKIILSLGQLKGLCGVSNENPGLAFSFDKAKNDLKLFKACDLPHLDIIDSNGITNISYDVDCSFGQEIEMASFINEINSIIDIN